MSSNRTKGIDPAVFGGELGKVLDNYSRLCAADEDARERRDKAERAVASAQATDIAEAAAALQAAEPAPASHREQEARDAAVLAAREAQVTAAAHHSAVNAVADEVTHRFEIYAKRLDKAADAATQTALNHLSALESALGDLQTVRSYRAWLDRPGSGNDLRAPTVSEAFALSETVRRPNGEPAVVSTLTAALHEALDPGPAQGDQRSFPQGLPVGAVQWAA